MRYPHITARIFNTPLLIHPQKLDAIIAGIGGRLFGVSKESITINGDLSIDGLSPELFSTKKGTQSMERGYQIIDGVAVIDISGATVHRSRMEAMSTFMLGYDDITADVEHAMDNPDVHAILRVYDSPGGEAQGAFEHADRMNQLLGKKPMYAIADGMAASAGYLAGSAADQFVITSTGYAGSIGVVMRHVDVSRAMANEGVQVTHIFAGSHKVDGNPFAPLPDTVKSDFQDEVNGLYDMFIQAVSLQRGMTADAVRATEAATYRGEQAVSVGLADRVSTTDNLISELAGKRSTRAYSMSSVKASASEENAKLSGMQHESSASLNSTKGVTTMNLEELRAAHPDLCAALVEEGRSVGFDAGASAERNRIQSVEAQSMAGHETLINTLKFDGKTTGPEAAVQVLNAERNLKGNKSAEITSAATKPVSFAAAPDDSASMEQNANLPIDQKAQVEWDKSPALQAEFGGSFKTYLAFCEASAKGLVKVANKKD